MMLIANRAKYLLELIIIKPCHMEVLSENMLCGILVNVFFYSKHINKQKIIHEILIIDLFCRISLISKWILFSFSNTIGRLKKR